MKNKDSKARMQMIFGILLFAFIFMAEGNINKGDALVTKHPHHIKKFIHFLYGK